MREFRIGRLNGRFVVTWPDGGKRRRFRLDARTAKEAEREALDVIRREVQLPSGLTTDALWQAYRAARTGRPIHRTTGSTGKPLMAHFGALRPDQITTAHCQAYAGMRRKAGIAQGSTWTELGHLRSALLWAQAARLIDHVPPIDRPAKPAPKERYLTRTEIDQLLAADCLPHVKLAILLMLTTAGRIGAVLDLTWQRVDLERGQINLRADLEGPRKGRAVVPINSTLRAALIAAQAGALSDHVVEWAGDRVATISKGFARAVENAGLADVTPHVLRHSAAVHMAEAGVPMEEISQFLGHSNMEVTRRVYARFSPQHLSKAAEVLDFGKLRVVQ